MYYQRYYKRYLKYHGKTLPCGWQRTADQHRVRANDQYRLDLADAARDAHL